MSQFISTFAGGKLSSKVETTSNMARENGALFAINGAGIDFKSRSLVVRNGKAYKDQFDPLEVRSDGTLYIGDRGLNAEQMVKKGVIDVFDFGPQLLVNGREPYFKNEDWFTQLSAPRTAIGQKKPYEFIIITVDGRSKYSKGMTFAEMAKQFKIRGARWAYNLDGGGSSALYYKGRVLNHPSDGHERKISDILYFKN